MSSDMRSPISPAYLQRHARSRSGGDEMTTPLTLRELKERPATLEEIQATLIDFIEHCNKENKRIEKAINEKQGKPFRTTL